jgi:hypothetical protein
MHALMSIVVLIAVAEPQGIATCRQAMAAYESGLGQAAVLRSAFGALEDHGFESPENRVVAAALFDRQEQLARHLQVVLSDVRRECRVVDGFEQVDAALQQLEAHLRRVETDSRHMKLRLTGGRDV